MTTCIVCGCTDDNACVREEEVEPGETRIQRCSWVSTDPPACSFCAEIEDRAAEQGFGLVSDYADEDELVVPPEPQIILPGDPEFHL